MSKFFFSCLSITCLIFTLITCGSNTDQQVDASIDDGSSSDASSDTLIDVVNDTPTDKPKTVPPPGSFDYWGGGTSPIRYHGGSVLTKPITVYFIWYGYWDSSDTTPTILKDLASNFGASGYQKINTEYYQQCQTDPDAGIDPDAAIDPNCKEFVNPSVVFGQEISVGYSYGPNLTNGDVQSIVLNAISSKLLPLDENGVYFVLSSKTVFEEGTYGAMCQDFCGWHNFASVDNIDIKFSFIGDPGECLDSCSPQSDYFKYGFSHSPNNNWSADAMGSVIVHELSEVLVDPLGTAWYNDVNGSETEDQCSYVYSTLYLTSNGSVANYKIGNRDYLIQTTWDLNSQSCILPP